MNSTFCEIEQCKTKWMNLLIRDGFMQVKNGQFIMIPMTKSKNKNNSNSSNLTFKTMTAVTLNIKKKKKKNSLRPTLTT